MKGQEITLSEQRVKISDFIKEMDLQVAFEGRGYLVLKSISVSRLGLQIYGYYKHFDNTRINVIGHAEYEYLKDMSRDKREEIFEELFKHEIPCLIFTRGFAPFLSLRQRAQNHV